MVLTQYVNIIWKVEYKRFKASYKRAQEGL